jgi:hypothetical protein
MAADVTFSGKVNDPFEQRRDIVTSPSTQQIPGTHDYGGSHKTLAECRVF